MANQATTFKRIPPLDCLDSLDMNHDLHCHVTISHYCYHYHLGLTPPIRGIKNAAADFQWYIDYVIREVLGDFASAYLDDVLIWSYLEEEHVEYVE